MFDSDLAFLCQELIEGFYPDTFRVTRPTVFSLAVTHLPLFLLFDQMIFTWKTKFDEHEWSP